METLGKMEDTAAIPAPRVSARQRPKLSLLFARYEWTITPLALIVLCVLAALLSDRFLTVRNVTNILHQASVLAIISIGMTVVIIGGGFDLSVGSVASLAGCVGALVMVRGSLTGGVLAGLAVGVMVGVINGMVISLLNVSPFIATLGTMVLVRGAVLLITGGVPIVDLPDTFTQIGTESLAGVPIPVLIAALLFFVFWIMLRFTPLGLKMYAVGGNREASKLSGVSVNRVTIAAYGVCGALAGAAGLVLAARLRSGQPTAGELYELTSIAAVVLGGASLTGGEGRLQRTVLGVLIIQVLSNGLNLINVHSYWQRVLIGGIIIVAASVDRFRRRD